MDNSEVWRCTPDSMVGDMTTDIAAKTSLNLPMARAALTHTQGEGLLTSNNNGCYNVSTTIDKRYHARSMMCPCCGQ
jgi:hypothetical protein